MSSLAKQPSQFWQVPVADMLEKLETSPAGLAGGEAKKRLAIHGHNKLAGQKRAEGFALFMTQFKSPITLILLFAVGLSLFLQDATNAVIIFAIIIISSLLGFLQEHRASRAVKDLLSMVRMRTRVLRDGVDSDIPAEEIVPGDIVLLSAGSSIPADCLVINSRDLFVNEAVLTGETYPVEKAAGALAAGVQPSKRTNSLFMGTHVVSGTATALVVKTGMQTDFGEVSERLRIRPPETEFERGVRRFGYLLMQITLVLVMAIFGINVYFSKPVLDSILFALALAVGLTPQLLPAIISVNLSHGARRMATQKVIVKRLSSIENFGSMNILCSDKTGTLTEGSVRINSVIDADGVENEKVLLYAYLNASYETGFSNPIDNAIRAYRQFDKAGYRKLDEIPYDFVRKRLTILVSNGPNIMITKGAVLNVLPACSNAETRSGTVGMDDAKARVLQTFESLSQQGLRVLGVSYKVVSGSVITKDDENGMTFLGFLVFHDPPKDRVFDTIKQLKDLGVALKIITGDNRFVAVHLGRQIGWAEPALLSGPDLRNMSDDALYHLAGKIDIFSDVEPNQKERIINALKKSGNVVGCLGDGINDAPALHAADVGISVNSAVDVAKEAADIVLLEKDLGVLIEGVREGRRTFANTLKYVFMATSANFGNMFSMAGISAFLSFLPLLPKQILLTNLLTDFPEMTIATDNVDEELVQKPRRWNIKFIGKFMFAFGILSSVFDFFTFATLLALGVAVEQFRTGWFIESVVSASLIVLVIRTRKPFLKSMPGRYLLAATIAIMCGTVLIPYTSLGGIFGFTTLGPAYLAAIAAIIAAYVISAEVVKRAFYRRVRF